MALPLSILTDEISQDLPACRAFLGEHAVDAVELRCVRGRRVPDLDPRDLATLDGWVQDGIEVVCVSPGTGKGPVDDNARRAREIDEVLPRAVDLALRFRAPFVVTFGYDNPGGAPAPAAAVDALRAAAERCAEAGLTLLVENEPGFLAGTAAETRALLDAVGHPAFRCNWDPCNGNEYAPVELAAAVELLARDIGHVHVKNGRRVPGARFPHYTLLADGEIDWPAHVRGLLAAGYRGRFGVETHFEPLAENSAAIVAELRAMGEG